MDDPQFEKRVAKQAILEWRSSRAPVDRVLNETLREHRVGSAQRGKIADLVYKVVRWWPTLVGYQSFEVSRVESVRKLDEALTVAQSKTFEGLAQLHEKMSPKWADNPREHLRKLHAAADFLAEEIVALSPPMQNGWHEFLHQSLGEAPFTVRVDGHRHATDKFMAKYADYGPRKSAWLPDCVHFAKRFLITETEEYKQGLVEIQDESSQLVAHLAAPQEGQRVLDLCAGAGGKTLHLAALMKGKGEIIAYDLFKNKLQELSVRARRAGFTNIRTLEQLPAKSEKFDVVLIDAPCSSLGTLRRSPDRFFRLDAKECGRIENIQRDLTLLGLSHLAPGGRLLYATCSVRPEENALMISQIVQSQKRRWSPVAAATEAFLGREKSDKLLALLRASPAARITGLLPEGCLQFGPCVSQASGSFEGDGFFVSLVN